MLSNVQREITMSSTCICMHIHMDLWTVHVLPESVCGIASGFQYWSNSALCKVKTGLVFSVSRGEPTMIESFRISHLTYQMLNSLLTVLLREGEDATPYNHFTVCSGNAVQCISVIVKTITSGMPCWKISRWFPQGTLCKSCYPSEQNTFPGLHRSRDWIIKC